MVKYIRQMSVIFLFSFLGELCRFLIPYPIPASIYGMVLLFAALALKIVPVEAVSDSGKLLVSILPVLFVAPTVNIVASIDVIRNCIPQIVVILIATTVFSLIVSGLVTQWLLRRKGGRDHE